MGAENQPNFRTVMAHIISKTNSMTDIFYLFGILYTLRQLKELHYFIFNKAEFLQTRDDIGGDVMGGMNKGMEHLKKTLKEIPQALVGILFFIWMITGVKYTEESFLFIILISTVITLQVCWLSVAIIGAMRLLFRGIEIDKNDIGMKAWYYNIARYSLTPIISTCILYQHYFLLNT